MEMAAHHRWYVSFGIEFVSVSDNNSVEKELLYKTDLDTDTVLLKVYVHQEKIYLFFFVCRFPGILCTHIENK
jgi:hypothetical protein